MYMVCLIIEHIIILFPYLVSSHYFVFKETFDQIYQKLLVLCERNFTFIYFSNTTVLQLQPPYTPVTSGMRTEPSRSGCCRSYFVMVRIMRPRWMPLHPL